MVPVLSEAITVVDPSVSTAGSFLTIAPRRAIRCTPIASTSVMTAARPSGVAATAKAIPKSRTSMICRGTLQSLNGKQDCDDTDSYQHDSGAQLQLRLLSKLPRRL